MAKIKNLLKKSTNMVATTLLLVSTLLPTLSLITTTTPVKATTQNGAGQLTGGDTWDTGNHLWDTSIYGNSARWLTIGTTGATNSSGVTTGVAGTSITNGPWSSGGWIEMVNANNTNSAGYALFNGAIDMAHPMAASATIRFTSRFSSGDSLGFILTPDSLNTLKSNINNAIGPNLGLAGLANSYFLGRDFYSNLGSSYNNIDGTAHNGWSAGAGDVVAIRNTLASGTLNPADYPTQTAANMTTTTGQAWSELADNAGNILNLGASSDPVTLSWTSTSSTATTATGTLSLKITNTDASKTVTLSTTTTLSRYMTLGFVGATGTLAGDLSVSINGGGLTDVPGGSGGAYKGMANSQVNYVATSDGTSAGTSISKSVFQPSTIIGNISNQLTVLGPTGTPQANAGTATVVGNYTYASPTAPTGYSYKQTTYGTLGSTAETTTAPLTIQNFDSTIQANPNQINVYYAPTAQQANFTYAYASGSNTPLPPSTVTVSGNTDATITAPTIGSAGTASSSVLAPPVGYSISGVKAPNGTTYSVGTGTGQYATASQALAAAINSDTGTSVGGSAKGTFGGTSNTKTPDTYTAGTNDFQVQLTPDAHSATLKYIYDTAQVPGAGSITAGKGYVLPTLPNALTQTGYTGDAVSLSTTIPSITGYTAKVAYAPDGTSWSSTNLMTGVTLASLPSAIKAYPYIYVSSLSPLTYGLDSNFQVVYQANQQSGKVNFKYDVGTPGTDNSGNPVVDSSGNPTPVTDSSKGTIGLAAALPQSIALGGLTGGTLTFDPTSRIPAGYAIDTVTAPDGTVYTDSSVPGDTALQAALAANPYFKDSSQSTNSFTISLKALPSQSGDPSVYIMLDNAGVPAGVTIPNQQSFELTSGLVGSPISATDIANAITTLTSGGGVLDTTSSTYNNWYITSMVGPQNNTISTAGINNNKTAAAQLANLIAKTPYILADSSNVYVDNNGKKVYNAYMIHLTYAGTLALQVPETISFGAHSISGSEATYRGSMDSDVSVYDGRGTPSPWTMTVQQTSPLIAYGATTGLISPSFGLDGALHFVDAQGNDTTLTGTAAPTVYNQTTASNTLVSVMSASETKGAGFYINVTPNQQVATWQGDPVTYKGVLTWTVSDVP